MNSVVTKDPQNALFYIIWWYQNIFRPPRKLPLNFNFYEISKNCGKFRKSTRYENIMIFNKIHDF